MTKTYKMQDLDCANCARKMEDAIRKLEGVTEVHVNFLTQKMILTADDARFEEIVREAVKCVRRVDPDCQVVM
ncbi:MAG: cation transporter [Clostridia bacterium]|mgnify:CR=1 FL=1|nr:cation transporter [Clostridia bacterium]